MQAPVECSDHNSNACARVVPPSRSRPNTGPLEKCFFVDAPDSSLTLYLVGHTQHDTKVQVHAQTTTNPCHCTHCLYPAVVSSVRSNYLASNSSILLV